LDGSIVNECIQVSLFRLDLFEDLRRCLFLAYVGFDLVMTTFQVGRLTVNANHSPSLIGKYVCRRATNPSSNASNKNMSWHEYSDLLR
jgi:hypothetical protein